MTDVQFPRERRPAEDRFECRAIGPVAPVGKATSAVVGVRLYHVSPAHAALVLVPYPGECPDHEPSARDARPKPADEGYLDVGLGWEVVLARIHVERRAAGSEDA